MAAFAGVMSISPMASAMTPAQNGPVYYAQSQQVSPAQAKRIALAQVRGGEVVDIRRSGSNYRVRVIARDGRVVDVYVDVNTGRVVTRR